jgi:ribosomal peptide maturation radical SAM protein 1
MKPVALISMPFASTRSPSIQLGLLTATLSRAGIDVRPMSFFVRFGALDPPLNEFLQGHWFGEWVWARAAFGRALDDRATDESLRPHLLEACRRANCDSRRLLAMRDSLVPAFIERCLAGTDWRQFGLIGFSVTYTQLMASLALARALKQRHPGIPIIFGGQGFEGGFAGDIMRACSFVDFVHRGEADVTLPQIVCRLHAGDSMKGQPGLLWRDGSRVCDNGPAPHVMDLDTTPAPDFDEYFDTVESSGIPPADAFSGRLPIETARGCWWGAANQCTFCGLNQTGLAFRSRRAERVIDMLGLLSERYRTRTFHAVDNVMDPRYVDRLFGRLAAAGAPYVLHYLVRPSLSGAQLGLMRAGGARTLYAGIESLSSRLLSLMGKGIRAVQNLQFMKWCAAYGLHNQYQLLYGLPGEIDDDYRGQAALIPKIVHLQPPSDVSRVVIERAAPLFFRRGLLSMADLRPKAWYSLLFPTDRFDPWSIAADFDYIAEDRLADVDGFHAAVQSWCRAWDAEPRPFLRYSVTAHGLLIEEGRRGHASDRRTCGVEEGALYRFCDDARTGQEIRDRFGSQPWVSAALAAFQERDEMVHLDGKYLSLALPATPREAGSRYELLLQPTAMSLD